LSDIADFLGIEQKDEINGSQVWDAYKRGNLDQIIQHCESDVEVVREIYKLL
jgi:predicted PolB exonuclease-like 3'-5' exonuclease